MTGSDAHARLVGHHLEMRVLAAELRTLSSCSRPDMTRIGTTRWRIAEAGRHRMELLTGTVFPLLERICSDAERPGVEALRSSTIRYRSSISLYVSRWSRTAIANDWDGYRREAEVFRTSVGERLMMEREVLLPLLRRRSPPLGAG